MVRIREIRNSQFLHNIIGWKKVLQKNKVPPFSFVYGGKNSDTFITKWEYSVSVKESKNPDAVEKVYTYRDKKSRLEVDCYVTYFKDFPAIEWMLKFSNRSDRNTPVLEQVAVADHSFSYKKKRCIYSSSCKRV